MLLNTENFEQARQTRDPRFDGRFFVGVLTTGIYCRPVCPVRIPKKENVQLYASAAAAAEAGYRPCLRCRPETSPGTPAWLGSSHTVARALQLIEKGLVDEGTVDALAGELDITVRQLSRLFQKHVGASPVAVAQTRRLHFAKQLIDETSMPMAEIAFAAGFGSLRRFNAMIKNSYSQTPRQLRRRIKKPSPIQRGIGIPLYYRPPFAWQEMLKFLALRAIPGVEVVTTHSYARSIELQQHHGEFCLEFKTGSNMAFLTIDFPDSTQLLRIVDQVRNLFDLKASSLDIERHLARDALLAPVVKQYPGMRVPGSWNGFEVSVRAIVGQQVSVQAATTLMARITNRHGPGYESSTAGLERLFPPATVLAEADLGGLGITGARIRSIHALASKNASGALPINGVMDTQEFIDSVCTIKGIGEWTAQYIALRALNDPDAFPHGDLILQRAAAKSKQALTARQLLEYAEVWRPWRAYAVILLWKKYAQQMQKNTK